MKFMKKNKKKNIILENILKMKQKTLKKYLKMSLEARSYDVIEEDGFLYAKGTHPVLLIAHMDTVHKECVRDIKYKGDEISSPQGIGGDDRCGCYAILEITKEINCSVLFTEDEEIGCIGASKFAKTPYIDELDVNYIIEIDRRGSNDCVFYDCDNKEFEDFITSTGFFKTQWGSISDISYIAPVAGVAAVNLSSGYHNEHTKNETINLEELNTIIKEAKEIIMKEVEKPFEYVEAKYNSKWSSYGYGSYYDYYDDEDDYGYERDTDDYYAISYPGYGSVITSKNKVAEHKLFHIYMTTFSGTAFCCEVYATCKMEAIGMVLAKYQYYSYADITDIVESQEYYTEEEED